MARIHLLDDMLIDQIAAGEVVERPAAVVKELVENSLDAGARRVDVELAEGGLALVSVRDDGSGMSAEDAELSVRRHATSKLRMKEELSAIGTFGFRGEALPSIAAVSRFSLLTGEPEALSGTRLVVEGGRLVSSEPAAAPAGTTIEVRDLFWNVPARRKFLKRAATEQVHALDALLRLAVPRTDVEFTARDQGRVLLRFAVSDGMERRAEEALGRAVRGRLRPFDALVGSCRAHGLCAEPEAAGSTAKNVWLFVNGRAVRDRALLQAVLRAYDEVLPRGRFPAALAFLDVPLGEVDVNVHPAKAEVRLADPRSAFEAVRGAIGAALSRASLPAGAGGSDGVAAGRSYALRAAAAGAAAPDSMRPPPGGEGARPPDAPRIGPAEQDRLQRVADAIVAFGARPLRPPNRLDPPAQEPLGPAPSRFAALRYLGQLQATFLVCEGNRGLVLIDQHAAHERIQYQAMRRRAAVAGAASEPLLLPRVLALTAGQLARLEESRDALEAAGLWLSDFGGGTVAVKAMPRELGTLEDGALSTLLGELCDDLSSHGRADALERRRDAVLARAACHASVRAHDPLSPEEAKALLLAIDETDWGARCAHGRPVVAEWSLGEIERRFGRDYASPSRGGAVDG
jgi:DNA mismatch repair protein MutL